MTRRAVLHVVLALSAVAGCSAARPVPALSHISAISFDRPTLRGSLFPADQAVLSNEAIDRILSAKIELPREARLTVLHFGSRWRTPQWWSEPLAQLHESIDGGLLDTLRASQRISDASFLPSLMTPERQTVSYLREAAARFQADLLLVYYTTSQSHQKEKLLARNQVKAYCTAEAVLLDVRTGIVPFSSVVTRDVLVTESKDDFRFSETIERAELEATNQTVNQIAEELVHFLSTLPTIASGGMGQPS
ncbi:MAG TPA: hypothetical protein VM243_03035 [Phycisphaerae bacterium]|nr:hypothetical protein [Phycisphaerae bacterium]